MIFSLDFSSEFDLITRFCLKYSFQFCWKFVSQSVIVRVFENINSFFRVIIQIINHPVGSVSLFI